MTQSAFHTALMDPSAPVPAGLVDPEGRPAGLRFDVYRNNVAGSLVKAVEAGFPVVRKLVGDAFFSAMATVFIRRHPPKSRILMLYGEEFPAFLAEFPPVAQLPYLPDVARLEQAIREVYHAADRPAADASLAEQVSDDTRLRLAPTLRLIRSQWPIHDIWVMNTTGTPHKMGVAAQDVLIVRPVFDPEVHLLPKESADWLAAIAVGSTIGQASASVPQTFDPTPLLGLLVASGAIEGAYL